MSFMDSDPNAEPDKLFQDFKNIIICCDGTGQAASHGQAVVPSNVARFVQALKTSSETYQHTPHGSEQAITTEIQQVVLYQLVSVKVQAFPKQAQCLGAFGLGLDVHVLEAYHFFVNNYEDGDRLFLFGFSRGAFTARAIASFIINIGLLKKEHIQLLPPIYQAYKKYYRPNANDKWVEFLKKNEAILKDTRHIDVVMPVLGLWDTVGSLGLPDTRLTSFPPFSTFRNWWNSKYAFHDMSITRNGVESGIGLRVVHAFQALALDEHRRSFSPTLLFAPKGEEQYRRVSDEREDNFKRKFPTVEQCWFPGVHTDIGGGYRRGILDVSDIVLGWMVDRCLPFLQFNTDYLEDTILEPSKACTLGKDDIISKANDLVNKYNETIPATNPWALSKLNDSYRDFMWKIGGSMTRTPGEYHLGEIDKKTGLELITNEYIHPSVRVRLQETLKQSLKSKNHKGVYNPPALAGFRLKKGEDYHEVIWFKEVTVNGVKHAITIPECRIHFDIGHYETRLLSGEGDAMDGVLHPWESPEVLNPLLEALDQDRRPWYKKAFSWVVGKVTFSSAKDHHANGYVRI